MGRRNSHTKSYLQVFQWLNAFASVDSRKTLPCFGLIEYSPKDQVLLKNTIGSTDSRGVASTGRAGRDSRHVACCLTIAPRTSSEAYKCVRNETDNPGSTI